MMTLPTKPWHFLWISLPFVFGALISGISAMSFYDASAHERRAEGRITALYRSDHNRVGYKFDVRNIEYTGKGWPPTDDRHVGQMLTVFYDDRDPQQSALSPFSKGVISSLGPVPFLLLVIGGLAVFGYRSTGGERTSARARQ